MTAKVERAEDRLADFTRDKRILILSLMAVAIGALCAVVAKVLVWLIAAITNLVFYQRFSSEFVSPANHHLGVFVILVPIVGGLVIGLMARYGSEKIRGHGIPEALEAILFGRSRNGRQSCRAQARVVCDFHRHGRSIRRRRADHYDGRRGGISLRADVSS